MEMKYIILGKSICLIVLIALIIAIVTHGRTLTPDKCMVKFTTKFSYGAAPESLEIKVLDLYRNITINKCIVKWANELGYYIED